MDDDIADEMRIWRLLVAWGHARDRGDWPLLKSCFAKGATIDISWMKGSADDFIARSKVLVASRKPSVLQKHIISGPLVQVRGARAISRCHVNLENRDFIDGHEVDLQAWFQFADCLTREDGQWRIVRRTAIYERDRLSLVDPLSDPAIIFAGMDTGSFPPATRFLSWWQARQGREPRRDIIVAGSAEARAIDDDARTWLNG